MTPPSSPDLMLGRSAQTAQADAAPPPTTPSDMLRKPAWIRVKTAAPGSRFSELKNLLRVHQLVTVCEEALCPNVGECFGAGTASFMILGNTCTRKCPFCNVGHGRPAPPDAQEPLHLAQTIARLQLKHVVVTSVNRDDLPDGGASHYADCISHIRKLSPHTQVEILVPDFRRCDDLALATLQSAVPDVFNHNLETVPRLYKSVRPGADYAFSLKLLHKFAQQFTGRPTKSGLMVGLGETDDEIVAVMQDMRSHGVAMLTIGQYLAPSASHLPVVRYVHPDTFNRLETAAYAMGFAHAAVGAMVRSSYQADRQALQVLGHAAPA